MIITYHDKVGQAEVKGCFSDPCFLFPDSWNQKIHPLDVIEAWSLCHHLSCVVICLARAGLKKSVKSPALEPIPWKARLQKAIIEQTHLQQARLVDLKWAEWYLLREINSGCQCLGLPITQKSSDHSVSFTPDDVSKDWFLSSHLAEALFRIGTLQKLMEFFPLERATYLKQALCYLRAEIALCQSVSQPSAKIQPKIQT